MERPDSRAKPTLRVFVEMDNGLRAAMWPLRAVRQKRIKTVLETTGHPGLCRRLLFAAKPGVTVPASS